jgi:hypothetical protein
MAYISDGAIVTENGNRFYFENIYPTKIIYPFALMSNHTAYNFNHCIPVVTDEKFKIDDIYYCHGNDYHDYQHKVACIVKVGGNCYSLDHKTNIISPTAFSRNMNITGVYVIRCCNNITIYTEDNFIKIKNNSKCAVVDENCQVIQINKKDDLLIIYLLKNNCIKIYNYVIDDAIINLIQTVDTHININKNIRNYFIDHDGLLYVVAIDTNYPFSIVIKVIATEYRFCDINISCMLLKKYLLLTFDGTVVSFDCSNTFTVIDRGGSFCLKKNQTKSARV